MRYFNVYGAGEAHKGRMASVVHQFDRQIREAGTAKLFAGSHGYGDGEQRRDFVYVGDVAKVNLWAANGTPRSGVFNVGTGQSRSFNEVARAVIGWHGRGTIEYIPFPSDLSNSYQAFSEAELSELRAAGYRDDFVAIEEGVRLTLRRQRPSGGLMASVLVVARAWIGDMVMAQSLVAALKRRAPRRLPSTFWRHPTRRFSATACRGSARRS